MLPQQDITYSNDMKVTTMSSKTWQLDFEKGQIGEIIDQKDAVSQAIGLILDTPRYEEITLPDWYGNELWTLVGKEEYYIKAEAPRMIREALLVDDRISEVKDFVFLPGEEEDAILIRFTAVTIFGDVEIERMIER